MPEVNYISLFVSADDPHQFLRVCRLFIIVSCVGFFMDMSDLGSLRHKAFFAVQISVLIVNSIKITVKNSKPGFIM